MAAEEIYDVGIVGGGLAGLCLAIQSGRAGYKVVLIEKENYPFHRVCGEYISNESRPFLEGIGLHIAEWNLPEMNRILLTDSGGVEISQNLPLGGFGISRYKLDHKLYCLAKDSGVRVITAQKVNEIEYVNDIFNMFTKSEKISARVVAGCFGKRSNIDVRWNRNFVTEKPGRLNNLIGIKYHVSANWRKDTIALHHFQNGYCGVSAVEDDKFCLCYLTTAANLQRCGSIDNLEEELLKKNKALKSFLEKSTKLAGPFTISQVSFSGKSKVDNHVLMVGDAAGMITPLCGNGMSMAMHSSKIAFGHLDQFLKKQISRQQMELNYTSDWNKAFSSRLRTGKMVQRIFGSKRTAHFILSALKPFPFLITALIKKTHGKSF